MKDRIMIAALSLSAAGLVGIVAHEGYVDTAMQPLPGDKLTIGFGSTTRPDGSPVQPGDKTTPTKALQQAARSIEVKESALKRCFAGIKLYQHEYDAYVSLSYNVGAGAVCESTIPQKLAALDYEAACRTILDFDRFRDKTKPKVLNPRTNKWEHPLVKVRGLTIRRQAEYRQCLGEKP
jgi:lysozyme